MDTKSRLQARLNNRGKTSGDTELKGPAYPTTTVIHHEKQGSGWSSTPLGTSSPSLYSGGGLAGDMFGAMPGGMPMGMGMGGSGPNLGLPQQGSEEWNKMVFDELIREAEELEVVCDTAQARASDIGRSDPAVTHARQRRAMALFMLGGCYERGRGCRMSLDKAISHYHQAAELGLAQAQYELALCYIRGSGFLPADLAKGMCYLRQAAAQDMPEALYDLGCHYANGEGLERDMVVAKDLFEKAIKKGNKEAVPALRRIITITEGNVRRRSIAILMVPTLLFMLIILVLNLLW